MQTKINGEKEDLSSMLIGAERYALGRRTYIVQWTCEFIGNNLHLLTEKDKQVMIRDIENPISYGDECDKECWMQLLKILKMEVSKMPKKKDNVTESSKIPKKIDNEENQTVTNQKLGWVQILLLIGKPLWDAQKKKWRVLNGYQSILGNQNNQMFFEVTFTDTPYWENFVEKQLYLDIPKEQEDKTENGDKGSDKKSKRAKAKDEK